MVSVQNPEFALVQRDGKGPNVQLVCSHLTWQTQFIIVYLLIFVYIIAVCSKPCLNNGTCSSPNTCTCIPGWDGLTCANRKQPYFEISSFSNIYHHLAVCSNACLNNGTCSSPNTCTCATGWEGPACESRKWKHLLEYTHWYFGVKLSVLHNVQTMARV